MIDKPVDTTWALNHSECLRTMIRSKLEYDNPTVRCKEHLRMGRTSFEVKTKNKKNMTSVLCTLKHCCWTIQTKNQFHFLAGWMLCMYAVFLLPYISLHYKAKTDKLSAAVPPLHPKIKNIYFFVPSQSSNKE